MTEVVKVSCFPNDGTPEVIEGSPVLGDIVRITTTTGAVIYETYTPPPTPGPRPPSVLSKTAFQDYAVTQLGGGLTGMGRFTEIMDATKNSSAGAVRFAYSRYEAANTFEKENTSQLTAVMAADNTEGHLTEQERTAILDNWP